MPSAAPSSDSPSTTTTAPLSIFSIHCSTVPGAPPRRTKRFVGPLAPALSPTEPRIAAHGAGPSPAMWNENVVPNKLAAENSASRTDLPVRFRAASVRERSSVNRLTILPAERIPQPHTIIVKIRTPRVAGVYQVHASCDIHRKRERLRHIRAAKPQPRAGFRIVGPVLMQPVRRQIDVPIDLRLQPSQKILGRRERVPDPVLRVQQHVSLKAAHEHAVVIRLREESVAAHQMPTRLRVRDAAAIIRNRGADVAT